MHKDPICGMDVKENSPFKAQKNGQVYYFCSARGLPQMWHGP
jgi:YHS domain-containing protein